MLTHPYISNTVQMKTTRGTQTVQCFSLRLSSHLSHKEPVIDTSDIVGFYHLKTQHKFFKTGGWFPDMSARNLSWMPPWKSYPMPQWGRTQDEPQLLSLSFITIASLMPFSSSHTSFFCLLPPDSSPLNTRLKSPSRQGTLSPVLMWANESVPRPEKWRWVW